MNPLRPGAEAIREMARILDRGGVVVFPTETFYGLGAHVLRVVALERIYALKGRPRDLPLLCLVDGPDRLNHLVAEVPDWACALMESFWPGPLTLVLPSRKGIPAPLIGPAGGVAVRWSPDLTAQALIQALGSPVVGTSANLTAEPPPVRIQEIAASILKGVDGILDGGTLPGVAPSTVLDCTTWPPRVIREGAVSRAALRDLIPLPEDPPPRGPD